ncbi:MAG TPA: arsenate reductase (glutaredoxin) [Gammaproteobacteria bacterium]|nr:arsenate reductase (glutaredoxin) [Gammaproteobacteria bacterium]
MNNFTIYHNPRCSKSRLTLELMKEKGLDPEIILYLETPPSEKDIALILDKLGMKALELLRKGETEYKELNLSDPSKSEEEIIQAMVKFPKLIERPIVITQQRAIIGRPPENVLNLINK